MYAKQQCSTEIRKLQIKAMLYFQRMGACKRIQDHLGEKNLVLKQREDAGLGVRILLPHVFSLANKALSGGIT